MPQPMLIAKHGDIECFVLPGLCNRHGLITGATGTGKTVTLQVLAERLSGIGVPVFMADVKGDLAGLSQPGKASAKFAERLKLLGVPEPAFVSNPSLSMKTRTIRPREISQSTSSYPIGGSVIASNSPSFPFIPASVRADFSRLFANFG